MNWLLDETYATDSLAIQAERTRSSLNKVEQVLAETSDLITHIQAPPFVRVKYSSIDSEYARPGVDFKLQSTIQNLGAYLIQVSVANGKGLSTNWVYSIRSTGHATGKYYPYAATAEIGLDQNYPNPFGDVTSITYHLSNKTRVVLEIIDMNGKQLKLLTNEIQGSGTYRVTWDGTDTKGSRLPNGMYFYRLITDTEVRSKRMIFQE